jgi:hypothetical protein
MNKTIEDLSVYELGGVDCDVWLSQNKEFGFDLEIENEEGTYVEKGLHPYAAQSLADFCRRYLRTYERILEQVA